MNLSRPLEVVSPAVDGDVLAVLAGGDRQLTGRAIHERVPASLRTVQLALARLVRQGVVVRETLGNAHLYRLNEEHLATRWIVGLASLRLQLIEALRTRIAQWTFPPAAAALFGSVARGDAGPESDLDFLLVRPSEIEADDDVWRRQCVALEEAATAWTGNDARIVEYSEAELRGRVPEPMIREAALEGIDLYGSLRSLLRPPRLRA